jgi:hypothetical protein
MTSSHDIVGQFKTSLGNSKLLLVLNFYNKWEGTLTILQHCIALSFRDFILIGNTIQHALLNGLMMSSVVYQSEKEPHFFSIYSIAIKCPFSWGAV